MNDVHVGQVADLAAGDKMKVTVKGKDILIANVQGSFYAMDNTCPHMGGSLADGMLKGSEIVCPKHGSVFDVKTGKVVDRGRLFMIKVKVHDLRCYAVKIDGSDLLIEMD